MKKLIAVNPELILLSEFYPAAIRRFGASPEKYLTDLQAMGFSLKRLVEDGSLRPISSDQFPALARGEGMKKLINIVCRHYVGFDKMDTICYASAELGNTAFPELRGLCKEEKIR